MLCQLVTIHDLQLPKALYSSRSHLLLLLLLHPCS